MGPSKNLGLDLGTSGGNWLFRQGELVLGPVPAAQIVEKLYSGDLDGRTEVQLLGTGKFTRLAEVDFFRVHLAKAEAKRRVETHARSEAEAARRRRNIKIGVVATAAVLVACALGYVGWHVAVNPPWKDAEEILYAELISIDEAATTISFGRARAHQDEELLEYPGGPMTVKRPVDKPADRPADRPNDKPTKLASPSGSKPHKGASGDDPDGMQLGMKFDQDEINRVVSQNQRKLFPCFAAEAQKRPNFSAKIPIEFVIGNDGKVARLWVDHPEFKEGSLKECLFRELQKWPFKPYEGERATVGLSFKIGKG